MRISSDLIQTYILGTSPEDCDRLATALIGAPPLSYASRWHLFGRLDRAGLIAVRSVKRTMGLDLFLLQEPGGRSVEDVAEFMTFATATDSEAESELLSLLTSPGCLFVTFIRFDWLALEALSTWAPYGIHVPSRSAVMEAVKTALVRAGNEEHMEQSPVRFHAGYGTGDSDMVIMGTASSQGALDGFLLKLTQLGTDCLALGLEGKVQADSSWRPILSASTTLMAVPWAAYSDALCAAHTALKSTEPQAWHAEEERVAVKLRGLFSGGISANIQMRRSFSSLANVNHQVQRILPQGWKDEAVLGDADIAVRYELDHGECEFHRLLQVIVRLDAAAMKSRDFPRRKSINLSFASPCGKSKCAGVGVRSSILYPGLSEIPHEQSVAGLPGAEGGLDVCLRYLNRIHDLRLREEFRIIERIVERCHILRDNPELPPHTRKLAALGLKRIVRIIEQLENSSASADELLEFRCALVKSGAHIDRTLSYLSRGSIPLLLASTSQARIADHFASETFLGRALGSPAVSVAQRLHAALIAESESIQGLPPSCWAALLRTLEDMMEPIIYSSHETDFRLIPPLGIIHVPRWVMWYPTASSFILHELGHAVFAELPMERLMHEVAKQVEASGFREFCGTLGVAIKNASTQASESDEDGEWRELNIEQQEIAAELFNRLFAYPSTADERYFFDQMEHLHAISRRLRAREQRSFLARALSVHIANRLIRIKVGSLWRNSAEFLCSTIMKALEDFRDFAAEWVKNPPAPFHKFATHELELSVILEDFVAELVVQCSEPPPKFDYAKAAGRAVQRGVFMALVATSLDRLSDSDERTLPAQLAWQAVILTSLEPETHGHESDLCEEAIVTSLASGIVPSLITKWPERLPRALHAARRKGNQSIMLEHRFALAVYLADWAHLGVHSAPSSLP